MGISVITYTNDSAYDFTIFYSEEPIVQPIVQYRILLDVIEIIEHTDGSMLFKMLTQVARGTAISSEVGDKKFKKHLESSITKKVDLVVAMIAQRKIGDL